MKRLLTGLLISLPLTAMATTDTIDANEEAPSTPIDPFVELIKQGEVMAAASYLDHQVVFDAIIAEIAESRGIAMAINDQVSQNMHHFDEVQVTTARIFRTISIELQAALTALTTQDYDVHHHILSEITLSGRDDCEHEITSNGARHTVTYQCNGESNSYTFMDDDGQLHHTGLETNEFGGVKGLLTSLQEKF